MFLAFAYGQARAWGSFGYAISALLAGFLFVKDPRLNFIGGSLIGICLLLDLLFWRPKEERAALKAIDELKSDDATPKLKDMVGLLKIKVLWQIIFFVMFSWTFITFLINKCFPEFYTSLFHPMLLANKTYGTLNSIQVFVEALMLGLVPLP